ncbi:ribonuclease domain-containing protein [Paraburkholderia azotifigens]|uniref:Ribonuclease n=1 Tax=Paraburkholderia azotifigens TaxID=2057004 RepID=A0ABU9RAQ7_9BURK
MARKWLRDGVLIAALTVGGLVGGLPSGAWAREAQQGQTVGTIAAAQLPPEAARTLNLIAAGGPYPYEKDGVVFGNRERLLPPHRRGYYHEYTVPTPGARDRAARRIVCGGPPRRTGNCYYSDDHYASFNRIIE